jgi:site-specific recombinase XerD
MSPLQAVAEEWVPDTESAREWAVLSAARPQLAATVERYLTQLSTFLAPRTVESDDNTLRQLARFLVAETDVGAVASITRTHFEDYKVWITVQPGTNGAHLAKNTQRRRLREIRIFFERLIEWDWEDAPRRNPIFHGDIAPRTDPLPRF